MFEGKQDIEGVLNWILHKIGVAGPSGLIISHDHLVEKVKGHTNLCVFIGKPTYKEEGTQHTRANPNFLMYLDVSYKLFHRDDISFGYIDLRKYENNEIFTLRLQLDFTNP